MEKHKMYAMILSSLGLMFLTVGITYSFFNYTRTGGANSLGTGRIYFNTNAGETLNLTNMFPMTSTEAGNANLDTVTLGITGDTVYTDGEEYEITLVDVNNTINGKKVPINYIATYEAATGGTIGTISNDYWHARESKDASLYTLVETGSVDEGKQVLVGYIDNGSTGISGTLTVKAYIDADRIAISDTYYENATATPTPTAPNDQYGTTTEWVDGRVVLTTQEWNSLQTNGISFKIKAESNQGIWAYPSVPTCQGCKFYYEGDSYIYTTWNDYDETPTVISSGTSDNYLDIISSSGKNFFLGMKLNNSSQVTNLYICGFVNNEPYCFEVDQDGSAYETNKRIIQNSNLWNNHCSISTTNEIWCPYVFVEDTDIVGIYVNNYGAMIRDNNGGFCAGYMEGYASCYDVDPN